MSPRRRVPRRKRVTIELPKREPGPEWFAVRERCVCGVHPVYVKAKDDRGDKRPTFNANGSFHKHGRHVIRLERFLK